ncbi:helix-turn-helix domain-containing protein [Streptomyces cinnamoneus]|uniref:Transcriptional regulator n=1 Tax=Streptomyces cinnamoneus TaxID=53446 RepID=A0A918TZV1_STRCJ|nr:helix-turn-helix transcriptional regulator [Streptomyces cinnamoneus]GHC68759.1 transcriptional regulator [Streptomyces cinnamoneus]
MATESSQPPMAWRYCGNQIKLWRTLAGVTREELGKEAGYEYESVKSMEQGRRRPSVRLLEVADEMCGAKGLLVAARDYLQPEKEPSHHREFMAIEAEAIAVSSYEPLLVPGLLQTEAYARVLMRGHWPPPDDETLDERVAVRLNRQEKLTHRPAPLFTYVIYEGALRSGVGGAAVMKEQLAHLLATAELRNVSLHVLPVDWYATNHLNGSLTLMETAQHQHYAYVEAHSTRVLYSDTETVSNLTKGLDVISRQALSTGDSHVFIRKVMTEL